MIDPLSIALYGAGTGAGAIGVLLGAKKGLPLLLSLLRGAEEAGRGSCPHPPACAFGESHMVQLHSIHEAMAQTARSLEEIAKDLTQAVTLLKVIASSGLA